MATHGIDSPGKVVPKILKDGISVADGIMTSLPHPTVHTMEFATV
jgi:hypothetical protein